MVIDNLHIVRIPVAPHEADPPLIVNPNAVLALAVAAQCFQPVASGSGEIEEGMRDMHQLKLSQSRALDGFEAPYGIPLE